MPNINEVYLASLEQPRPVTMSPTLALGELLDGHRAGHYTLPEPVVRAADGLAALQEAHGAAAAALRERFASGWRQAHVGGFAAVARSEALATGRVPADVAGELLAEEQQQHVLEIQLAIFEQASRSAEDAPLFLARRHAADIAAGLDAARAELLSEAAAQGVAIAGLDLADPGALLGAGKAAQGAYRALEALLPRWSAILAAGEALAALSPEQAPAWPIAGRSLVDLLAAATP